MINYRLYYPALDEVDLADGFFEAWPQHPDKKTHRKILNNSFKSIVAIDDEKNQIIGFINIISDGVLSAYIPLLEVIPDYRNQGIGSQLMQLALKELDDFYMIDLVCDQDRVSFYEKLGMTECCAMVWRNYRKQSGE
ncbi:MAG: GNAT family N-acetyltransferase [Eubacteriales bacterium]|nr:GNAT family N-acetyltransferase [Eubacteriales bacterium]MDD4540826.1 GNAT family N-acetyltransferase [Eubacteriales bacterium]